KHLLNLKIEIAAFTGCDVFFGYLPGQSSLHTFGGCACIAFGPMLPQVTQMATYFLCHGVYGTIGIQHRKQSNFLILSHELLGHFINNESAERRAQQIVWTMGLRCADLLYIKSGQFFDARERPRSSI